MQLRRIRRATHTLMPGVSAMTIQETANNPNAPSVVDDAGDGAGLRQSLGTLRLIFLIIAAAAPMAAVLGVVPVAFAFGNGAGLPLTFLAVALVLGLFSIGYSAMSKEIVSAGAFYAYIARGLGVVTGLGGAFLAIVSYVTFICGAVGYFAFFSKIALHDIFGIDVHWTVTGIFAILFCAVLGYRQIDFSSRMLALLLMAEFVVLIILSGAIVWGKGAAAFPASVFSLDAVLSGAPGVAVMLAFTCFIGVESAALYSEEAKAPSKSVGTATIGAILITVCFYFLTTWITVGAVDGDIQTVASAQVANLYFGLSDQYIGGFATKAMMLFLATSMLATNLAVHNVSSRYIFSLGRQSSLPAMLGRTHPRFASPHVASLLVTAITAVVTLICIAADSDPLLGFGAVGIGLGTVGIIALQALTSLAVVAYFRRQGRSHWWTTLLSPLLSFLGLGCAVALAVSKFDLLTGLQNAVVLSLPLVLLAAFLIGCGYAIFLRNRRPHVYDAVSRDFGSSV
jgi:amino acid transporter